LAHVAYDAVARLLVDFSIALVRDDDSDVPVYDEERLLWLYVAQHDVG
jgi:hypothetical protein